MIQILSLITFIALIAIGKLQLWLGVFFVSLLLSIFKGRFYCGYICPINTSMEVVDDSATKKGRKRRKTPDWIKSPILRVLILGGFLFTMNKVLKSGKNIPVLLILVGMGVFLTMFFEPSLWHKHLCPYGTLLSAFASRNNGYEIYKKGCIKCGKCVEECPAEAITWKNKNVYPVINKKECLSCDKCAQSCPRNVIQYR